MITLGKLIDAMEPYKDADGYVSFDFAGAVPTGIDSYRGWYERLSIAYSGDYGESMTPKAFYAMLTNAVGSYYTGWKGGTYRMDRGTLVHIACPGCTSDTIPKGIEAKKSPFEDERDFWWITIITENEED
jgi:hypothetical protein